MLISFMLLLLCCTQKQTSEDLSRNDSIEKYLKWAGNDSLTNTERNKWNQKAFGLIDLSKNDTVVRWYLCQTAFNYSAVKNAKRYFSVSKIHFKKAVEANDTLNLARFYRYRASYYKKNNQQNQALYFYIKAAKFYKKTQNVDETARIHFYIGLLQLEMDDYLGAEVSERKAFNLIKEKKPNKLKYQILIELGNIDHNLKNYDRAIETHKEALKLAISLKLSVKKAKFNFINTSLNNIGNSYKEQKKYNTAIQYFEKAIQNKKNYQDDKLIFAYLYTNLGYCKMQLKDYENVPQLFEKAIKIFKNLKLKENECAISHVYLSEYYLRIKDTTKAISYSEKAVQLAKYAKAPYYYLITLSHSGSINKEKAPQYIKEYHHLNDSLQFEQRKARSQFYKIQLETDEIAQEKDKAVKQKWLIASVISGVLLIVILLFVIYRQRARQKELHLRQNQQQTNEEIYQLMLEQQSKVEEARQLEKKRIALELHDGVMNRLVSTRMNLFVLSRKNDPETIANCLGYIADIRDIENEIRDLSHNLNQENFNGKGSFKTLLEQFVTLQNNHRKTQYNLDIDSGIDWDAITNEAKMHLYRIVQEAANNINKHAKAKQAAFSLTLTQNHLYLAITDDGIGFDPEKTKEGIGLKNILQRVTFLKGSFDIQSDIHNGTTLMIVIPLTAIQ